MSHKTDLEIAQSSRPQKIVALAKEKLNIPEEALEPYGQLKAKINLQYLESLSQSSHSPGRLILVTALSPTPAGEGKTTTTVGLGDALQTLGKKTIICLREPSLGPVFGLKGGAAGGGYSQVIPMEDINLHFTGDFNAIQLANNLLAAMIDNHIHHGNELDIDPRRITWRRALDMNDRALREITQSLGGVSNGFPRQDGFDIVVASEIMAILCLSTSIEDLKNRLGQIVCAYDRKQQAITAADLQAHGAMAVLLKDAIKPNLVQTLEGTPAILHGGPFANIAHGCNSVIATKSALQLADYVVTEAGFGADLGAEKFIDIKCRKSGLKPDAVVVVATIRALKYHGGVELKDLSKTNVEAINDGFCNLERHLKNMRDEFQLPCIVAINHFHSDTHEEIECLTLRLKQMGVQFAICKHWEQGGKGAIDLAKSICHLIDSQANAKPLKFLYAASDSLVTKIEAVATRIYKANKITVPAKVLSQIEKLTADGFGQLPICIAKTQYSFSSDALLRGAPENHTLSVREVRLMAGAEFIVVICGDVMTMPGLPKRPAAERIDLSTDGKVIGLF